MSIIEELSDVKQRRVSYGQGATARERRKSVNLSSDQRRRISKGYERFLSSFVEGGDESSSKAAPVEVVMSTDELTRTSKEKIQLEQKRKTVHELKTLGKMKKITEPDFDNRFHEMIFHFGESRAYSVFILVIILLNTCFLVAQTWQEVSVRIGWYCIAIDNVFLGIYIMEIVIKIYIWRKKFFKEGWNVLDFGIVLFGVSDFVLPLMLTSISGNNGTTIFRLLRIFRAIRAIRALRVLRTIRFLATLQVIMTTLLQSIRSIGAIVALITLFMYMFAVVGRGLYAEADPQHFGNIIKALFTLFQLLTLDDWFDIYRGVIQADPGSGHIIIYLLMYIVVEYFVFLNLFVAVLVDNFQLTLEAQNEANKRKKKVAEDSDDEEDYLLQPDNSEDGDQSEPEEDEGKVRKSAAEYYHNKKPGEREKLHRYFCILAALEHNNNILANQQRVLDMMVDICNASTSDEI